MVSKLLEDLFPFLPREESLANMIVQPLDERPKGAGQIWFEPRNEPHS
jgi:hypothetical protein